MRQFAYYPQVQQVPQIYYPGLNPVYSIYPGILPSFGGFPVPYPYPGLPVGPAGVNPQNPVEVEDPADNQPNEDLTQGNDEDTVAIDSA